jgi:hypothetical protein
MTSVEPDQLIELQALKDLLTTQKEVLALRNQITELSKALETSQTPAAESAGEPAAQDEQGGDASKGESSETESDAKEKLTGFSSYLSEITAYEILKTTAKKIANKVNLKTESNQKDGTGIEQATKENEKGRKDGKILVIGDRCPVSLCLPLSDVVLQQTKHQIEIINDQVVAQTSILNKLFPDLGNLIPREENVNNQKITEGGQDVEDKSALALPNIISSFLSGWGSPVTAASELVKGVVDLLGEFAAEVVFQEQEVTLPLDALVVEVAGLIKAENVYLLGNGCIEGSQKNNDSVLDKLNGLFKAIQELENSRIKLTAQVVEPLNAGVLKQINKTSKLEANQEILTNKINATKERIGELKVKSQHETDPATKAKLQIDIDFEDERFKQIQNQVNSVINTLVTEMKKLGDLYLVLNKVNAEVEVATNLVKTFTSFFQSVTTKLDDTTLSTLAQAVLREYISGFDYLLRLSIHSGKSETITRKILGFISRGLVGGCAVSYTLTTNCGRVVKSGLEVAAGMRRFSFDNPERVELKMFPS